MGDLFLALLGLLFLFVLVKAPVVAAIMAVILGIFVLIPTVVTLVSAKLLRIELTFLNAVKANILAPVLTGLLALLALWTRAPQGKFLSGLDLVSVLILLLCSGVVYIVIYSRYLETTLTDALKIWLLSTLLSGAVMSGLKSTTPSNAFTFKVGPQTASTGT